MNTLDTDDGTGKGPRLSIALTTFNGADTLPATLASLSSVIRTAASVEVLLVDNGSTDDTPRILADFAKSHDVTLLHEPKRGKSHGLDRAITESRGELLAFIDDDVILSDGWLQALLAAADAFPQAAVFAGQIRPDWAKTPPDWQVFLTEQGRCHGCTAIDRKAGEIHPSLVKGGNMMVRTSLIGSERFIRRGGAFDRSKLATGGEDTGFAMQLTEAGHSCIFVPGAIVLHRISGEEMQMKSVFQRYVRIGRSVGLHSGSSPPSLRRVLKKGGRMLAHLLAGDKRKAALSMIDLASMLGQRQTAGRAAIDGPGRAGSPAP